MNLLVIFTIGCVIMLALLVYWLYTKRLEKYEEATTTTDTKTVPNDDDVPDIPDEDDPVPVPEHPTKTPAPIEAPKQQPTEPS